jgi:hypothetical protein
MDQARSEHAQDVAATLRALAAKVEPTNPQRAAKLRKAAELHEASYKPRSGDV